MISGHIYKDFLSILSFTMMIFLYLIGALLSFFSV